MPDAVLYSACANGWRSLLPVVKTSYYKAVSIKRPPLFLRTPNLRIGGVRVSLSDFQNLNWGVRVSLSGILRIREVRVSLFSQFFRNPP